MKRNVVVCAGLAGIVWLTAGTLAQNFEQPWPALEPNKLYLSAGTIDTRQAPNVLDAGQAAFELSRRYVIQLDGPLTPQRQEMLAEVGVRLGGYLPLNAFIADLSRALPADVGELGFVQWVGPYRTGWKVDPAIGKRLTPFVTPQRIALAAQGKFKLVVTLFEGEDLEQAKTTLAGLGATIVAGNMVGGQGLIDLVIDATLVDLLAEQSYVQWIEEGPELTLRNSTTRWIVQSNVLNVTPLYDHGIRGAGQIVGVIDGLVNVNHCSFRDTVNPIGPTHRKIQAYNATPGSDSHGTHVAGTAIGDAGLTDDTRGIAYEGRLVYNTIPSFDETSFVGRLNTDHGQGARAHTNSWGDDGTTAYNGLARAIDVFSYDNEDDLVLFAVTNTSTLRNPENAKDVLAVGASQDTPNQGSHCSGGAGPTSDGRRKPEIYAPGCSTNSSNGSSCSTIPLTGTSMASPAVTGVALLVRQYFTDGYYPTGAANAVDERIPSGALIKAVLLNSAVDMTGVSGYPSNQEGWGRVLSGDALYFPGDTRKLSVEDVRNADGLSTAQNVEIPTEVLSSGERLKVTLVWTDPPASSGASFAAINDLDLEVVSPTGSLYRGNVFSGGVSVTGGTKDDRNNVEQVHLNSPAVGIWTVRVVAAAVNQGRQGYALAITGDVVTQQAPLAISLPDGAPTLLAPGVPTDFNVEVVGGAESIVLGSPTLHYRYGGGSFLTAPLASVGGDLYVATLPPAGCADSPEFYVSAEGDGGSVRTDPPNAPTGVYSAIVGELATFFDDPVETDQGWTTGAPGDTATTGIWTRVNPNGTAAQPEDDHTPAGTICFVTGQGSVGGAVGDQDVDGGFTTLLTPVFALADAGDVTISYWRWYSNVEGANPDTDVFRISITNNGGSTWVPVESMGAAFGGDHTGGWVYHEFQVTDFVSLTNQIRMRFVAEDNPADGGGSIVEAAIDDFNITGFDCSLTTIPPQLLEARSVAVHQTGPGTTAEFYIGLDITDNPATRTSESRNTGISILDFVFDQSLVSGSISIKGGADMPMTLLDGGTRGRVNLAPPLVNGAVHTITINASTGPGGDLTRDICVSALIGDFNSDGLVDAVDKGALVGFFGQTITQMNARYDLQVNGGDSGTIEVGDVGAWTGFFGGTVVGLPCP